MTTALQSMTGFGAGEAALGEGLLRVELRSVNHRHLDLRVRAVEPLEVAHVVEEQLRGAGLVRGHVDALVRWEGPAQRTSPLDLSRAREVYAALCALRDELNPGQSLPVEAVLQVPGILRSTSSFASAAAQAATELACRGALAALHAMRTREGAALKRDLLARSALAREHVRWIAEERPRVLSASRERLSARITKLLEGSDLAVDPARLAQELAWFADRSDVAEETTRLLVHLEQLDESLERGGAVGRKLDFLVQELGREINTIGGKANDTLIAQRVVEMKAELERIREQVQNIL